MTFVNYSGLINNTESQIFLLLLPLSSTSSLLHFVPLHSIIFIPSLQVKHVQFCAQVSVSPSIPSTIRVKVCHTSSSVDSLAVWLAVSVTSH